VRENWVKKKLRQGGVSIGSWVSMEGVLAAEVMANIGFDWLVIDMEHGPVAMEAAQGMIAAIRTTRTVPLVRVGWNESALIQTALDIGAYGLVVPMVSTLAEAQQAVRDARYPPLGERSRGGMRARLAFGTDAVTYGRRANDETLVLVQIETAEAMANAAAMAALEGIDGLFLGPNDLASALGCWPPVWDDQPAQLAEAIARVPVVAHEHGKVAGIMVPNADVANRCIGLGYEFIALTSDAALLEQAARRELAAVTAAAGAGG
jgi:4-hydroxy-2-oxoheptanedioate aldolase